MRAKTVHFASLTDICHLKNSELEPKFQKYKGGVVLRGDIVKEDSGSHAVFTEQGSSASQMTAAKGHGCEITRRCTIIVQKKDPTSECPDIWIRLPKHPTPKSLSSMEDAVVPLERNLYGHPLAVLFWERQFDRQNLIVVARSKPFADR